MSSAPWSARDRLVAQHTPHTRPRTREGGGGSSRRCGLLVSLLACLALASCAPPLRVGTSGDYPPFSVRADDGTWDGFDVAVARAYARDRGKRLVVIPFRWPELEAALVRGAFDVAMSGITVRADRLRTGRFTAAVARVRAVLVTRPGIGAVRVVAVNRGGHLEGLARERLSDVVLLPTDDNRGLLGRLRAGLVDAVVTDTAEAGAALAAGELVVRAVLAQDRKAYWLAPTSGVLQADLDGWLLARERDGTLAALRRRYLGAGVGPPLDPGTSWAIDLLGRRLLLMPEIAAAKRAAGLPLVDPERERVVLARVPCALRPLFAAAVAAGRAVQLAVESRVAPAPPDLGEARAALDRIDSSLVEAVTAAAPIHEDAEALLGQLRQDAAVPGLDEGVLRRLVEALRAGPAPEGCLDGELPRGAGSGMRAASEDRRMGLLELFGGRGEGIKVGDPAPDFALPDAHGRMVRLSELRGRKPVVLFFYPKDDTPGCTKEACSFRDAYEEFVQRGAEVIGISSDDEASHRRFAERHRLPFTLLADHGGKVRKAYGVPATLGLLPGRVTYVIDLHGIVRHVFNSQLQATQHVTEALEALRRIEAERP